MHVRIQDYGKKEHDKKYSKKDEYKKVGTCKVEQHHCPQSKNIWVAETRDFHIKRFGSYCSAHPYLPKLKLCAET